MMQLVGGSEKSRVVFAKFIRYIEEKNREPGIRLACRKGVLAITEMNRDGIHGPLRRHVDEGLTGG